MSVLLLLRVGVGGRRHERDSEVGIGDRGENTMGVLGPHSAAWAHPELRAETSVSLKRAPAPWGGSFRVGRAPKSQSWGRTRSHASPEAPIGLAVGAGRMPTVPRAVRAEPASATPRLLGAFHAVPGAQPEDASFTDER